MRLVTAGVATSPLGGVWLLTSPSLIPQFSHLQFPILLVMRCGRLGMRLLSVLSLATSCKTQRPVDQQNVGESKCIKSSCSLAVVQVSGSQVCPHRLQAQS